MWTKFEAIPVHGDQLRDKPSSCVRLFYENVDGFSVDLSRPALKNNTKLAYFSHLLSRLQVDVVAGVETCTNWSFVPSSHSVPRLLNQREGSRSVTAHNEHERFSLKQQGGTFITAFQGLGDYSPITGKDPSGLGRWCWLRLGQPQCSTRIVVAYQACNTRKTAHCATMAQQRRYWISKGDRRSPRAIFCEQFLAQLRIWRSEGEKLLVLMDANEDMQRGKLARELTGEELKMVDVI